MQGNKKFQRQFFAFYFTYSAEISETFRRSLHNCVENLTYKKTIQKKN